MPIVIKTAAMKYKDSGGTYVGVDAVTETTTSEQVAAVEAAGAAQVASINSMITGAIEVSGATPTITAEAGKMYVCTTEPVTELTFTPSAEGVCAVRFVSGTTPTVLTLPNTVRMPDWWTGVEASRTYEINIETGIFGVVTSWA